MMDENEFVKALKFHGTGMRMIDCLKDIDEYCDYLENKKDKIFLKKKVEKLANELQKILEQFLEIINKNKIPGKEADNKENYPFISRGLLCKDYPKKRLS